MLVTRIINYLTLFSSHGPRPSSTIRIQCLGNLLPTLNTFQTESLQETDLTFWINLLDLKGWIAKKSVSVIALELNISSWTFDKQKSDFDFDFGIGQGTTSVAFFNWLSQQPHWDIEKLNAKKSRSFLSVTLIYKLDIREGVERLTYVVLNIENLWLL